MLVDGRHDRNVMMVRQARRNTTGKLMKHFVYNAQVHSTPLQCPLVLGEGSHEGKQCGGGMFFGVLLPFFRRSSSLLSAMKPRYGPYTRLRYFTQREQLPVGETSGGKPLASEVLTAQLADTKHWTSYFVPYRSVVNDQFGWSHFNWTVPGGVDGGDDRNYHVLRIGCYPYIKYHCSTRPYHQGLPAEDKVFRWLKAANLGLPTLAYGLGASMLIKHHKDVTLSHGRVVRIFFLYEEDIDSQH